MNTLAILFSAPFVGAAGIAVLIYLRRRNRRTPRIIYPEPTEVHGDGARVTRSKHGL